METQAETMPYDFSEVSILIIEDSQPMTKITTALLKGFGVKDITVATDADDGFEKFSRYNHDLVLIDWLLKPINGIELTHKIRMDANSPNPFVPVILMTGFSNMSRVIEARDTGVTEFLVKPFSANDLYKRIDHVIMKPRQFVKSLDFFGPDRRRKHVEGDHVPQRREQDQ